MRADLVMLARKVHMCEWACRRQSQYRLVGADVRPNPVLAPRSVYETKTQHWPELTVLPWPEPDKQQPPSTPTG